MKKIVITITAILILAIAITIAFILLSAPNYNLEQGDVIVGIGDSITAGGKSNDDFLADEESYSKSLGDGYFKIVSDELEDAVGDLTFYNIARNGTIAADWFDKMDSDVLSYNPNLVIVTLGANDFLVGDINLYQATLDVIAEEISASGSDAIFILPFAMIYYHDTFKGSYRGAEEMLDFRYIAKNIAEEHGFETVDIGAIFDEHIENGTDPRALSEDGIHPTDLGEKILAEAVLLAIENS